MKKAKTKNQTSVAPATATDSASEITTTTIAILKPESSNFLSLTGSDIDSMSYNQLDGLVTDGCKEMVLSSKKAIERQASTLNGRGKVRTADESPVVGQRGAFPVGVPKFLFADHPETDLFEV